MNLPLSCCTAQIPKAITVRPYCSNHGPEHSGYSAIKYFSVAEGLVLGQAWMKGGQLCFSVRCGGKNTDLELTESCVELMQAEVAVVVVVVVPQQVLHGALQQTVLHVLLHGHLTHIKMWDMINPKEHLLNRSYRSHLTWY